MFWSTFSKKTGGTLQEPDIAALIKGTYETSPGPDQEHPTQEEFDAFASATPLWFYILAEGTITVNPADNKVGQRLDPVGSRIVAEVILGVLQKDPTSYLNAECDWRPQFVGAKDEAFDMTNFYKFAESGNFT